MRAFPLIFLLSAAGAALGAPSSVKRDGSVAVGWYANYHSSDFPLSSVSWSKYTTLNYFSVPTGDSGAITLSSDDQTLLPQFVQQAHQNNVKAVLTIGGYSGSQFFSQDCATDAGRTQFAQSIMALVKQYSLDGIDFDWEFPGQQGASGNTESPQDSANFLLFLQTLRQQDGASDITLSAAVSDTPFVDANGAPLTDVSGFAKVFDYVEIMNYDAFGPAYTKVFGPNAPLDDSCAPSGDQRGSAKTAVGLWTGAGFPAGQLVLGVPAYGYGYTATQTQATGSASGTTIVPFGAYNGIAPGDTYGGADPSSGVYEFFGMVDSKFLNDDGSVASGMVSTFDDCSQTPYVYDPSQQILVAYENAQSFEAKGSYVKSAGLKGFSIYEVAGDHNDILLDAIRGGAGF
ncbi:glycoside hydrolase family 18 protein [Coniophora puteana RWD-64-598 SS2]|uniref:Glycoside hydrolase family 18 protein n=1 Tax=Coniophora puteana (strain RWD-64-598) TaxID=741705 RepID=A0A5M3MCR7_CONPW|nr:glycoside hydrolase family 18 protein [Coniophora puteana RWD-64-598 SS2]EIW77029.1 glycoside hydrolase family 18 protein [Coniophora puteana RWD-64-598 SS2]